MPHGYVEQLAITLLMVTCLRRLLILPKNTNAISIAGSLACLGLFLSTRNSISALNLISCKNRDLSQSRFADLSIVKTWAIAALPHSQTRDHLPKAAASVQPSDPKVPHLYLVIPKLLTRPTFLMMTCYPFFNDPSNICTSCA